MALDTLVAPAQQSVSYPLDSPKGLRLHNVSAQAAELLGQKGVFVTMADEALSRLKALPGEQRGLQTIEQLAVIEAQVAGVLAPGSETVLDGDTKKEHDSWQNRHGQTRPIY